MGIVIINIIFVLFNIKRFGGAAAFVFCRVACRKGRLKKQGVSSAAGRAVRKVSVFILPDCFQTAFVGKRPSEMLWRYGGFVG